MMYNCIYVLGLLIVLPAHKLNSLPKITYIQNKRSRKNVALRRNEFCLHEDRWQAHFSEEVWFVKTAIPITLRRLASPIYLDSEPIIITGLFHLKLVGNISSIMKRKLCCKAKFVVRIIIGRLQTIDHGISLSTIWLTTTDT